MLAQVGGGEKFEVLRADEFCNRGKCCFQCVAKRDCDVVAVDVEAAACIATLPVSKARRARGVGVK